MSINWIGVIWCGMWICVLIGSFVFGLIEHLCDTRKAKAARKRKLLEERWYKMRVD